MFKKLKDKIAEEVKSSPQRIQQFTQSVTDRIQGASNDDSLFSIGDDDTNSNLEPGFTNVALGHSERRRRSSTSSLASDVSFLPRYEPASSAYHLQSDLDASASDIEDNASTSSQLGHVSKEQVYSAFQKAQMRYHKYRGRYTDLANHYKELERENSKMKSVLVETQDKAIRRVSELKEQCVLEQKAKAHLESALQIELDEREYIIKTLKTKIDLLRNGNNVKGDLVDLSNNKSEGENLEVLTKYLNEARVEIESLNSKIQEYKAAGIVFQSKESQYKQKISDLDKLVSDRTKEIDLLLEKEKESNLKIAQTKMELHSEIQNKDAEIDRLKHDMEEVNKNPSVKLENLQGQNLKLIERVENLAQKCNSYESELVKLEQYKIELENLGKMMMNVKQTNAELLEEKNEKTRVSEKYKQMKTDYEALQANYNKLKEECCVNMVKIEGLQKETANLIKKLSRFNEIALEKQKVSAECVELKVAFERLRLEHANFKETHENDLRTLRIESERSLHETKEDYATKLEKDRENTKQSLLMLESRMKTQLEVEYSEKEAKIRKNFEKKLAEISKNEANVNEVQLKLIDKENEVRQLGETVSRLETILEEKKLRYNELENNYLDLITENNGNMQEVTKLKKELNNFKLEHEKDNKMIQEEISLLQQVSSDQQNKICALEKENKQITESSKQLEETHKQLKGYETEAEAKTKELARNDSNWKEQLHNLEKSSQDSIKQKEDEIAVLKRNLDDVNHNFKQNLQETYETIEDLKQKLARNETNSIEQLNELEKKHVDVLKQKENYITSLKCKLEEINADLKGKQHENQESIEDLQQKLAGNDSSWKDQLTNLEKRSQDALKQKDEEIASLKCNLEEVKVGFKQNHKTIEDLTQRLAGDDSNYREELIKLERIGEEALKRKENEIAALKCNLEEVNLNFKQYHQETYQTIENFKQKLEESDSNWQEELNNALKQKDNVIAALTHNLEEINVKLQQSKEGLDELQTRLDYYKGSNETIEDLRQKLAKDDSNYREELIKLEKIGEDALKQKENEIVALKQYLQEVEVKFKEKQQEIAALKVQLNNCREVGEINEKLKVSLQETEVQLKTKESLYVKLTEYENKHEEQLQELDCLKQLLENKNERHESEKKSLVEEIFNLKEFEKKYLSILDENQNLREQISEIEVLHARVETVESISNRTKHEYELNKTALDESLFKLDEFRQKSAESESELLEQGARIKTIASQLETALADNKNLKIGLDQLQSQLFEAETKNKQLTNDYKFVSEENESVQRRIRALEGVDTNSTTESIESLRVQNKTLLHKLNFVENELKKVSDDRKTTENQLDELEKHLNEITNEKQLLRDEIDEFKIAPLSRNTQTDEIENLREKLHQYKSLDLTNRTSIEFYETELQKVRNKNEKLNRKLDETLVTLNHCAELSNSTEIEYLRNVLYNYMLGKESLVLARVIAAVCKFDPQQTETVLQKEQQKQTLLGQLGIL